jgi:5-oxoprolinase (ATP-hydrolysing)
MEAMNSRVWRLAADRGGTFTDCVAVDPAGQVHRCKVLSSGVLRMVVRAVDGQGGCELDGPAGFCRDFFRGWSLRCTDGREWEVTGSWGNAVEWDGVGGVRVGDVVELRTGELAPVVGARVLTGTRVGEEFPELEFRVATTLATNALLEGTWERPVLFVTAGFGDILEIGDQRRADLFALGHFRETPLHGAVVEVAERLGGGGGVVEALDADALAGRVRELVASGHRTAAVALLHSDLNPEHERQVREVLRGEGFRTISLSSELAPVMRYLPRVQTAVINAALAPVVEAFASGIRLAMGDRVELLFVTSAGGLVRAEEFRACDSLLSGPAGGVSGCAMVAESCGEKAVLTLDMGGTSTDVARHEGLPRYQFEQRVGRNVVLAPALAIETVAAGGGSVCRVTAEGLTVGPGSAGADPGPACYGKGGPLTLTDVNLLLGRLDPARAGIPLQEEAARRRLAEFRAEMAAQGLPGAETDRQLLTGLLEIAVARMAEAVRRISVRDGCDPAGYALVAFGGAGPQHACAVARQLGIRRILVSPHAGLLSAWGALWASREAFAVRQVLRPLDDVLGLVDNWAGELGREALERLGRPGVVGRCLAELRLMGQGAGLLVEMVGARSCRDRFAEEYERLYGTGLPAGRSIELVSLRSVAREERAPLAAEAFREGDESVEGPCLVQDGFSTLVVEPGWRAVRGSGGAWRLDWTGREEIHGRRAEAVEAELFRARFQGMADAMGELLKRTAVSANVKERLDYSCALLDPAGNLVVNAPHIPVHLGALGECVRRTAARLGPQPGDLWVTNDPAFGGSHLPDVTVICPVFAAGGELAGYVANRAHHAEIGGMTPGSMPPAARCLAEEGVVLAPQRLDWGKVEAALRGHAWPSRAVADNLADLRAQVASVRHGAAALGELCARHGVAKVGSQMHHVTRMAAEAMARRLAGLPDGSCWQAGDVMDDGTPLRVRMELAGGRLRIDFTGSGGVHAGNRNATPAIVRSAVLYVLRLWIGEPLPLNEGLLEPVDLELPVGLLNPPFAGDPESSPAVVGGNVETSQRVVELLVRALGLEAASQGTMNNVIFGASSWGHYETICGGSGAGRGYHGLSGIHTHMTNTAITDTEVLERRFPVRIREFRLRCGSGGRGAWVGGDGVRRVWEFLEPVTVSLLTEHRVSGPPGQGGGECGLPGRQWIRRGDGREEPLGSTVCCEAGSGDVLVMETPGGGGWGDGAGPGGS